MRSDFLVRRLHADAPRVVECAVRDGGDGVLKAVDGALGEVVRRVLGRGEGGGREEERAGLHFGVSRRGLCVVSVEKGEACQVFRRRSVGIYLAGGAPEV